METVKINKGQGLRWIEGFVIGFFFFAFLGYLMYFVDSFTNPNREPSSIPQRALQMNFLAVQPETAKPSVDFNKIATKDLKETDRPEQVAAVIADRSINQFFSSDQFRQSKMGVITDEVKESVRADVQIQQHRFSARLEALQGQACVSYSGYLDAEVKYSPVHQFIDVEFKEKISTQTEVFMHSKQDSIQIENQIGVRWDW